MTFSLLTIHYIHKINITYLIDLTISVCIPIYIYTLLFMYSTHLIGTYLIPGMLLGQEI